MGRGGSSGKLLSELSGIGEVKSIAFPSISTGVYRFPIDLAAKIAVGEILHFLETDDTMEQIILVCFDEGTKAAYQKAFAELTA